MFELSTRNIIIALVLTFVAYCLYKKQSEGFTLVEREFYPRTPPSMLPTNCGTDCRCGNKCKCSDPWCTQQGKECNCGKDCNCGPNCKCGAGCAKNAFNKVEGFVNDVEVDDFGKSFKDDTLPKDTFRHAHSYYGDRFDDLYEQSMDQNMMPGASYTGMSGPYPSHEFADVAEAGKGLASNPKPDPQVYAIGVCAPGYSQSFDFGIPATQTDLSRGKGKFD